MIETCKFDGCDRPVKVKSRQLCSAHYCQLQRAGYDESLLKPLQLDWNNRKYAKSSNPICKFEGCNNPTESWKYGLCDCHYQQLVRNNYDESKLTPQRHKTYTNEICRFDDCPNFVNGTSRGARGLCNAHYAQLRKHDWDESKLKPLRQFYYNTICLSVNCNERSYRGGLCNSCYRRNYINKIKKEGYNKSEVYIGKDGYALVKGIPEHLIVMELKLGRELFDDETVHHKNGLRSDNDPNNLELWSHSQPYGQRVEDKVKWAREFVSRYGMVTT